MSGSAATAKRNGAPRRGRSTALLAAACVVAAFGLYRETLGYALVGHDTYPLILAARVENGADFAGTFTEELMDGRYPQGHFYRPVLNLSFALDHALGKLNPAAYHATDLVLLAACAFLAGLLLRREGRVTAAGITAAALFLVHPVHLNVLPVAARRGDTLALVFLALAFLGAGARGRARWWAPGVCTLLAVGAKESALVAPLLVAGYVLLVADPGRLRRALAVAAGPFAAVLLFAAARQAVLGGIGGHGELTAAAIAAHAARILPEFERLTFYPYPVLASLVPGPVVRPALVLILAAASVVLLRRSPEWGAGAFAWLWMVLAWAVHGLSQAISPWYAIQTTMPFAILSGLLIVEGIRTAGRAGGRLPRRIGGAATATLLLALGAVNLRGAPPFAFHPEWMDATRLTNRYLRSLASKIDAAPPGSTIDAPGLPYVSRPRPGSPIVQVYPLADYTVQAWADLTAPRRHVRVAFPNPPPAPPGPNEVLVIVSIDPGWNGR